MIVLDIKYAIYMAKNGKYIKQARNIARRMHLASNGKKFYMHKIDWCEGGLQLADNATKNFGEPDLTPKMKYVMVRVDN